MDISAVQKEDLEGSERSFTTIRYVGEAGLTDADIPKTWDEMIEVAKKLTIKDGDKIVQAGLNFNDDFHQNYLLGLNYSDGRKPLQGRRSYSECKL